METRDLQEQVHSLAHYLAQGHDWKWQGQRGAHNGKVVIAVEVDAFTFWDLHAQQQQQREELRKRREATSRASRERALGRRGIDPGAKISRDERWAPRASDRQQPRASDRIPPRANDRTPPRGGTQRPPRPDDWR